MCDACDPDAYSWPPFDWSSAGTAKTLDTERENAYQWLATEAPWEPLTTHPNTWHIQTKRLEP